jgi:hypothetical protein
MEIKLNDSAHEIIRTKHDELRYEFKDTYNRWIAVKADPSARSYEVDFAWNQYCEARDKWFAKGGAMYGDKSL